MRTSFFVASAAFLASGALASPVFVTTIYPTTTAAGSFSFGPSVSRSLSFGSGTHTPGPTTTAWTQPPRSTSGTLHTSYVVHLSDTTYTTIVPGATPGTTHTDFGTPSISVSFPLTTVPPAYSQGTTTTPSASEALHTSYVVYLSDTTYTTIVPGATPGTTHTNFGTPSLSLPRPSTTVPPAYSQGTTTTLSASEALYTSYVVHLSDTTYTTIVPGATPGTTHTDFGTPSNSIKFPSTTVPPAYSQGTTTTGTYSTSLPTVGAQQLGSIKSNGAVGIGMGAGAIFTAVLVAASAFVSL